MVTATEQPSVATAPRASHPARGAQIVPGLTLAVAVAALATLLGRLVPIVGGPVLGIVLGAFAATLVRSLRGERWAPGYNVAAKPVLQLSIVVLGTGLPLQQVLRLGGASLPVMLGTLAVALSGAWLLGRFLGVRGNTQILIGVGTGICGASAIAATTPVIKAKQTEVAYAIGTIFTFNIAAVLLFPPLGHLLRMSPHAFGLWSGTAINDTSSVVAASFAYGGDAGSHGLVVKLTRTLMLIPIVTALALLAARREARTTAIATGAGTGTSRRAPATTPLARLRAMPWHKIVPLFLLGFLAAATADSLGFIPSTWHATLSAVGTFLITTALAGIGLSMSLADMRRAGPRPLLLGALLWAAVALSSLGLQALTGTL